MITSKDARSHVGRKALAIVAATATAVLGVGTAQADPNVRTGQGTLRGAMNGDVEIFRGIPFAKPPVGALRWRAPQPPARWTGVRDAKQFGSPCIQIGVQAWTKSQSEDCLYLNVWRPANARAGAKLPVMFWIHGGGGIRGTGLAPHYEGSHIARKGVVQVTINYRLGRLGTFAHPALSAETPKGPLGNYGTLDQIAALKWVKANIAAFGGNPGDVTIFGESAGGFAVNNLMVSPLARGLFAKAIAQSGPPADNTIPIRGDAARTGEKIGVAFAQTKGITGTGAEALTALRALPALAFGGPQSEGGLAGFVVDGVVLKEAPGAAFKAGREAPVPYLTGANSYEASVITNYGGNPEAALAATGDLRPRVMALFGSDPKDAATDLWTAQFGIEPSRNAAELHTRNGHKAWLYHYSYLPPSWRGEYRGAPHGSEMPFVFNTIKDEAVIGEFQRLPAPTPEDIAMADTMIGYWVAFAKNGDPGTVNGLRWAPYDPVTETVLEFAVGGPRAVPSFQKERLDLVKQLAKR